MTTKKSRSGTNRSHAERLAAGRPSKTYALSVECVAQTNELASALGLSRSQVVTRAVAELHERMARIA